MIAPGGPTAPEPEPTDPDELPPQPDKKYDELPLTKAEEDKYKKQRLDIRRILLAKNFDGNQPMFEEYFTRYSLGRWTHWKNITSLPGFRRDLGNYFRQTKSGTVYDHLNALVLDFMNKLVRGNYNPAARINAMLAIGELNSVEQSGSDPAVPYPGALKALVDAVNDADLPDAIRAAAMVGVLRHAEAGIRDEGSRRALADAMLRLATADPPTGPSAAGREWIMAQAVDTLGLLGSTGDGNGVFKAMTGIVSDTRLSDRTRSVAAGALGQLNYAGAAGIDPVAEAAKLARFTADCCAEETRLSKESAQSVSRRRIKQRLEAALTALTGVDERHKGIMSLARRPDQQALLAEMHESIKELSDVFDDRRSEGNDLGPPIEKLRKKLETWMQKQGGQKGKS
ncbi:MAG: hypothetical protein KKE86_02000 [Planctomycetes bacterium]|nr:hypothetical protein [Planctomycetota bacterium]MBU4398088.1 hypothetical protein [Planctomycetota bacterium]MCG2684966.1 hypothetical protein [Planctomycetales bacterium]